MADPPTPFPLARNAGFTAPLQVPSANWGLTVHCAFDEGDRRFERTLSMSQTQRQAVSDALHAEVNGANVLLVNSLN